MYENGIIKNLDNAKIENHCNDLISRIDSIHLKNLITISLSINIADAVVVTTDIRCVYCL